MSAISRPPCACQPTDVHVTPANLSNAWRGSSGCATSFAGRAWLLTSALSPALRLDEEEEQAGKQERSADCHDQGFLEAGDVVRFHVRPLRCTSRASAAPAVRVGNAMWTVRGEPRRGRCRADRPGRWSRRCGARSWADRHRRPRSLRAPRYREASTRVR